MENDDEPIGQILSCRDALKLLGMGSAAFLAACASPSGTSTVVPTAGSTQAASTASSALDCVVRPEMTIGPYFVDEQLDRSDIRSEPSDNSVKEGVALTLNINVASVGNNSCTPLEGAQVDIWHCDAHGQYSGVSDQGFDTSGQTWKSELPTRWGKEVLVEIHHRRRSRYLHPSTSAAVVREYLISR